ncbi:MAG TPA: carboxypeptidase-like regulatory domain-containing protein [Vicinamibacterales bacterium]|nr:carboxypeptidase-like regulatory domain-containing protein [Vicinamibacterales bacterium]
MARPAAFAVILLIPFAALLSAQAPGTVAPQARATPDARADAAAIRGRVMAADRSAPIRNARVQLTAPELPTPKVVASDMDGRFEFIDLPTGRFTLTASAPGYITLAFGQQRAFESGRPIALAAGQVQDEVTMTLLPGGAIAGRLTDETGQPLVNANVRALRPQFVRGRQQLVLAGTDITDDLGEYRIFGLTPGNYFVSGNKRLSYLSPGWTVTTESGYPPSYFPGTADAARARPVSVRASQTTAATDFVVDMTGASSISGSVFDSMGKPALFPAAGVSISTRTGENVGALSLTMSGDGVHSYYMASALPPGQYQIAANSGTSASSPLPPQRALLLVTVNGENVTGADLRMQPLPEGRGRILIDPVAASPLRPDTVRLRAIPADPAEPQSSAAALATPNADWTFSLRAAPGRTLIRPTLGPGWALQAVRLKGADVTDSGIEFIAGEDIADIEVELTNHPIEVSGSVRDAKGEPTGDYTVVVFSRDERRRDGDSRNFAVARPDQTGRFSVVGLAPGDYLAAALPYLDPSVAQDPALLKQLEPDATAFIVADHESKTLQLKLAAER